MAKPHTTKIALIQMQCGPEPEKNFAKAVEFIRNAAKRGAQIFFGRNTFARVKITGILLSLKKCPEDRRRFWETSHGKPA
jgi:hypothetical protein